MTLSRRRYLQLMAASGLTQTAGCQGESDSPRADILAGPEGRLVFTPEQLEFPVGETVRWFFASAGHNIACRPEHSDLVELPEGAEPFSTYDPNESPRSLIPKGKSFTHTFDVQGAYTYACIPHEGAGMIGQLLVTA